VKPLVVIDTNVLQVANQNSPQAGPKCVRQCIDRLLEVRDRERIALDKSMFILEEYRKQGFSFSGQPGVGDEFFRWLFDNQANNDVCELVDVKPTNKSGNNFAEFPDVPELEDFDRSDRKFVAVAINSGVRPPILNAVDSDWWDFRDSLCQHGVKIEFVCPRQFK